MNSEQTNQDPDLELDASLGEALADLRYCSATLLRALVSATHQCRAGHLRIVFEEQVRALAQAQRALAGGLGEVPRPGLRGLANMEWLASRALLPERDDDIVWRVNALAHDLCVRCQDVLSRPPPLGVAALVGRFAETATALKRAVAQHQPLP